MSTPTASPRDFITTRWSLVACAGHSSSDERHAALAQAPLEFLALCRRDVDALVT